MAQITLAGDVIDDGLAELDAVDEVHICSSQPTDYDDTLSKSLGLKTVGTGFFGTPEAGSPGRKSVSDAITDGEVTANGTATHWAALDTASSPPRLLATGPLNGSVAVTDGQSFTLDAISVHALADLAVFGAGDVLLGDETDGFAVDATVEGGSVTVRDTGTPANDLANVALDDSGFVQASASPKYVLWDDGTIHTIAAGHVAQEYDAAESKFYILTEPESTNYCPRSQEFENGWSVANANVDDGTDTAPNGTSTAATYTADGTNSNHILYRAMSTPASVGYISIFAKAGTASYFALGAQGDTPAVSHAVQVFDLATGEIGETHLGSGSGTVGNAEIVELSGGWYRCGFYFEVVNLAYYVFSAVTAASGNSFNTSGHGTNTSSGTIKVWGAELKPNDTVMTSYIPTPGDDPVTRARDQVSASKSGLPYSATAGTLYVDGKIKIAGAVSNLVAQFSDAGAPAEDRLMLFWNNSNQNSRISSGATDYMTTSAAANASGRTQGTLAAAADDGAITADGSAVQTDVSLTMPVDAEISTFELGTSGGATFHGKFYRIVYVPRRVIDADLPTWRYNF